MLWRHCSAVITTRIVQWTDSNGEANRYLWFAKTAAGIGINNIAAGVVPAFWYNSLPCFDSSDFSLEQWFASFARGEVYSSKIWRYANNFPF